MNHDEYSERLAEYRENVEMLFSTSVWKADYSDEEQLVKEDEQAILAEHDHLTAEVERLRWHYPERGELPDEGDELLVEINNDDADKITCLWHDAQWFPICQDCYMKLVYSNGAKRWRYIE